MLPLFFKKFTEMKNLIVLTGIILIVFNTLIGLIISKYSPFNYILVDFSLLISTFIIYFFSNSNISIGYKIGLSVLFSITGFIKLICCIISPQSFQNNFFIATVLAFITFEIFCVIIALAMKKFQ